MTLAKFYGWGARPNSKHVTSTLTNWDRSLTSIHVCMLSFFSMTAHARAPSTTLACPTQGHSHSDPEYPTGNVETPVRSHLVGGAARNYVAVLRNAGKKHRAPPKRRPRPVCTHTPVSRSPKAKEHPTMH